MYLEPDKKMVFGYLEGIRDAMIELSESKVPDEWRINAIYGATEAGKKIFRFISKKKILFYSLFL